MDAMDVLGALLGRKTQSSGPSADILKDMLGGRERPAPAPPKSRTSTRMQQPNTIDGAAKSLEDILGVSKNHHQTQQQTRRTAPAPEAHLPERKPTPADAPMNAQSEVLVRAMISAAKADGQIDQAEQENILKQFGQVSQDEINYLRAEFAKPADARAVAWSVPLGMEEQAYTISLLAMDLDENKEAQYLGELAHGLRLSPQKCNELHRQYKAPEIFQA
ncbi:tellurite resistance TerB family protein [Novipirellula artificiosorum]|uniref:Inner membrane protein YebE n=1 Tax=Novipirellula artificiosorum TaxID=2528016 RepID=A0A5C6DUU1_9BACT|nr:DUF533 domain-containing protein [Novipirellula artificiosorum]TWU40460.1 hypothetical protein Poly41_12930 [Novipirellula artificiosorum]